LGDVAIAGCGLKGAIAGCGLKGRSWLEAIVGLWESAEARFLML
jgi:2-polyprenyl-6-methoxyphenol hydroxylase-like FAD-dependent oxidoreductase